MLKAADIMTKDVATIRSSATVAEAVKLMKARDWRALIVDRHHDQDAYGMITETDIVYKVIAFGKDPNQVHVYEIMTKPCIVVNPDLGLEYVARLFADYNLLRAPVIQGELLGIISITDIVTKSKFIEQPGTVVLENRLQDAIKEARAICAQTGPYSKECAAAWDIVQDLESEIAHQRSEKVRKTVLEDYTDEYPEVMPT
ncbi:CBS domain-containing protein [Aetokthonos hydrillicola Thurmond2011]|jgi:CBS domain-containing protein|uniref:CBS domain-containing protein n=1 Tax=Aetokthonos hydrillicola Thurmond2011 TaxID=2712845 RepID=A0AAP5IDL9_9CYAN|nr:CBS domain-containing protein [Aetokthonos hydrillicola]MBO3457995.1 CBS domain-containing protein [Aetokthonos hydrillicola CCALA 1050]MBW4587171.1 CBS domain-containing protein [Aetokthonos hydrillicola CCALA 1050]MDR9899339.1 CBS domain-containing protein [Aetokthonos hydrillicola Thurmond2011]